MAPLLKEKLPLSAGIPTSPSIRKTRQTAWLCRLYRFCASHRLVNPQFTEEENWNFYGKCTNPHGHGHNFLLEVAVGGPIDPMTGHAFDPQKLDAIVWREVINIFDHKNLNFDVPELTRVVTTGENTTRAIWKILTKHLPAHSLQRIQLVMSPSNRFEYFGEVVE